MEPDQLHQMAELSVADGGSETNGGSRFIGYACKCTDLQAVHIAYLHMKRLHSIATHVTMAYILARTDIAYNQDYVDN